MHKPNLDKYDKVFIRDLTIDMFAGIYDFERKKKQRVIVNVDMYVECNKNKELDSIDNVVSYEDIVGKVIELASTQHYDLLESFCEDIASLCLSNSKIHRVIVRADKPNIMKETKTVGIEIIRSIEDFF